MKLVHRIEFERAEREVFDRAFNAIHRLQDYPYLYDYSAALRVANALSHRDAKGESFSGAYLVRAMDVLRALDTALLQDQHLYSEVPSGSPVTESVRKVLIEARRAQREAIKRAIDLLRTAGGHLPVHDRRLTAASD